MHELLLKLQWMPIGKKYDTGDKQKICPICGNPEMQSHDASCELYNTICKIAGAVYR